MNGYTQEKSYKYKETGTVTHDLFSPSSEGIFSNDSALKINTNVCLGVYTGVGMLEGGREGKNTGF